MWTHSGSILENLFRNQSETAGVNCPITSSNERDPFRCFFWTVFVLFCAQKTFGILLSLFCFDMFVCVSSLMSCFFPSLGCILGRHPSVPAHSHRKPFPPCNIPSVISLPLLPAGTLPQKYEACCRDGRFPLPFSLSTLAQWSKFWNLRLVSVAWSWRKGGFLDGSSPPNNHVGRISDFFVIN